MAPKNSSLRIPPQSLDSEKALLGSLMLKPEGINDVFDVLRADSFYADKHRTIFSVMMELFAKGEPIDLLSLSTRLSEKKKIDAVGGKKYLTELVDSVPSASNLKHYADVVQNKAIRRSLINSSTEIEELGYDEARDLNQTLDEAEKKIFSVTQSPLGQKFIRIKETLTEAWERIERLHSSPGELRGVSTGFPTLDKVLAGFQRSDLIILAARPSMGKTSLALDIARKVAVQQKVPVGIFSLEMSAQQLVDRMLAAQSRVDAWQLRTGRLKRDDEFTRLQSAIDELAQAPIFIDDKATNNVLSMRSVARRLKLEHGLGLIVVDYLQLMAPTKNFESMVQQVTEISRSLKALARELDVPVLALSQLSRAVEQRQGRPRLSDLRDSGSIEQDADVVMFIHKEDRYKEGAEKSGPVDIIIDKHRNGPTGVVQLSFDAEKTTFLESDTTHTSVDTFGGF